MQATFLSNLPVGASASVLFFEAKTPFLIRLKELGLTEGVKVKVTLASPDQKTICLDFRGARFIVRRSSVDKIGVII